MRSLRSCIVLNQAFKLKGFATTRTSEAGYTAIEAAVAAALLGVVLVPLAAFVSYLALTDRAALYGEAVRLAETYAETALRSESVLLSESSSLSQNPAPGAGPTTGSNSFLAPVAEEQVFEESRLLVIRTRTTTSTRISVTVQVKHARTGRVLVALERSAFASSDLDEMAGGAEAFSAALLGGRP